MGSRCAVRRGQPAAMGCKSPHSLHTVPSGSESPESSSLRPLRGTGQAPTYIHTYVQTCSHRQSWLCLFPLAYLVEWPWKTKQVLSTFDFSAFKLILSAQLLKQLSSPAVSNFRLGTFTGCQVLSLHCESLSLSLKAL